MDPRTGKHPRLARLVADYRSAPAEFHATSYWAAYEDKVLEEDAWHAHKRMSGSGGYFQACWKAAPESH